MSEEKRVLYERTRKIFENRAMSKNYLEKSKEAEHKAMMDIEEELREMDLERYEESMEYYGNNPPKKK